MTRVKALKALVKIWRLINTVENPSYKHDAVWITKKKNQIKNLFDEFCDELNI